MPNPTNAVIIFASGQLSANVVLTGNVKDGELVNADFSASAALAYSKLALTGSIIDADVSASAAIAMSKLSLSITNNEVNASAGIVDTKLATISTAGKVSGAALTLLGNIPAGAGTIPTANLPGGPTLLYSNSGTDQTAGAATVASIALSGLGANDTIKVFVDFFSTVATTTNPKLYSVTDSKDLAVLTAGGSCTAGNFYNAEVMLKQAQDANTIYSALGVRGITSALNANQSGSVGIRKSDAMSSWQGSWTLGLAHEGVTATGTFKWSIAIYKFTG